MESAAGLFTVCPPDIPNEGILFMDHSKQGRSGHPGNTLVECHNGDIVSFFTNISGNVFEGHGVAGWSEYKRSTDGGTTWGPNTAFEFSKNVWDGNQLYSALVVGSVVAPNGTIVAIIGRFNDKEGTWGKKETPLYSLSSDHGFTWTAPQLVDDSATVDELSLTYDSLFVHDNTVYAIFTGGADAMCQGPYSLYASQDNGETFAKVSDIPLDPRDCYCTGGVLDDGAFIVYSYASRDHDTDEKNLPYVISSDNGRTWSEVRHAVFAKKLRNPQMSEKVGDLYFMHGRSGSYGEERNHLVLYASRNGIDWDEGVFLKRTGPDCADSYSANEVIGRNNPALPTRILIQSSVAYDGKRKTNVNHWWVENIVGS